MYQILPKLYLSNFRDAQNAPHDWYIINCSKDLPMVGPGLRLPINDDLSMEAFMTMEMHLPRIIQEIDRVRASGQTVLVHCFAGQQRSAAVVAAYLMSKGLTREQAIDYIKSVKFDAFFMGVNFDPVLRHYSRASAA
jgi:protein-tyrosine phosphatase